MLNLSGFEGLSEVSVSGIPSRRPSGVAEIKSKVTDNIGGYDFVQSKKKF